MFPGLLSENVKIVKVQDHTTAGTSAVNSDAVDMQGYEGVMFVTSCGTAAIDNTINAAQSDDSAGSPDDFTDLEGSKVVPGASDEDLFLDVFKPKKRYVRAEIARGTSTTLETIWAILYSPRRLPVDNTTTGTIAGEAHVSPEEGTA